MSFLLQVLHIRNLPYETTHEELVELAQPFGRLVQSKLNVGPNRNQAFIEFPDQAPAVTMCNYFNGSADPAKVTFTTRASFALKSAPPCVQN